MLDHLDVRAFDIVPNALLNMDVWAMWSHLIEAVASNDIEWVCSKYTGCATININ
jgi:hypothetical protein